MESTKSTELSDLSTESSGDILLKYDSLQSLPKTKSKIPYPTIAFLIFLYIAQGIGFGNNLAIPMLLIDRNKSLTDIAILSQAFLPYSFEFLLAPIVDTFYIKKIGYRKTWVCGFFLITSILFFYFSFHITDMIQYGSISQILTMLVVLTCSQATADIAVDAWALAILSDSDPSFKMMCETSGSRIGQMLSKTIFILLESEYFSNKHIRPFFGLETEA